MVPPDEDLLISSVDVYVELIHANPGALTLTVTHPDGTTEPLPDPGGTSIDQWYDDITTFSDKHSQGTWSLDAAGDTGEIHSWKLRIEGRPPPVVVVSAVVGEEPVIAWAYDITDSAFDLRLIDDDGVAVASASVQWIAVAVDGFAAVIDPDSRLAIQTEHIERNNAVWVEFPIRFDPGITAVVNNAHSDSPFEPYIASPRSLVPARFISAFIDHTGDSPDRAWLQTIAVGEGAPDTNLMIHVGNSAYDESASYQDGDFIFFPTSFAGTPVVVANAYGDPDGAGPELPQPLIASAWGNASHGFFISLRYHNGASVTSAFPAEVQWMAVGPRP